jgi:UrcA family protein
MRKLLPTLTLAAIALAGASAPAMAGEVTIRVSAEGLDLTRTTDILTMKARIDSAVGKACNKAGIAGRYGALAVDECIADGTAKALAELDARLADQS